MEMDSNPITKPRKKELSFPQYFMFLRWCADYGFLFPWQPAIKISPGSLSRASLCREMNWPL